MNNDCNMIYESYGTMYRGSKTEQDSKDYSMNLTPFMYIIKQLSRGTFDTDSEQDTVSRGELQGIFDVEVVDGKRQVVLTNDAVKKIEQMYPELKGKFWECGKCKADYKGCGDAKHEDEEYSSAENEERRIDPKCWKGYHKHGTKLKGGVRVNNCVKNS